MRPTNTLYLVLVLVAAAMFAWSPFMIDAAPLESTMGLVQKIFYYHAPAAMMTFLSAFICGISSAIYLMRRKPFADHVALASAELAVLFGVIVLVTGPLWARKAWGVWWQWGDVRLMTTFIMWMVFVSYLLLRRFGGPGSEMLASVVSVFGMALVPFVYWSVNVWRTIHPQTTVATTLPPAMRTPFIFCIFAFLLLHLALLFARVRLARLNADLDAAVVALEEA